MAVLSRATAGLLPPAVHTQYGATFDPRPDVWCIPSIIGNLNTDFHTFAATDTIIASIKQVAVWYLENHSAGTVHLCLKHLRQFLASEAHSCPTPVANITDASIMRYRATLERRHEHLLGSIAGFLKKWHELALPGIEDGAISILDDIVLKGPIRNESILTMDTLTGPFTHLELVSLLYALTEAYRKGTVSLQDYLFALLFPLLGQRPVQYAMLKVCDVVSVDR